MSTAVSPRLSVERKDGSMPDEHSEVSMSEFMRISGLHLEEVNGSRVRGSIEFGDHHHTPWGVVHGGVYSAAVESAASMGASGAVEERGQFAVGVSNNTDFLRPMKEGRVDVVAEPIIQRQIQQLWQVIICWGATVLHPSVVPASDRWRGLARWHRAAHSLWESGGGGSHPCVPTWRRQ